MESLEVSWLEKADCCHLPRGDTGFAEALLSYGLLEYCPLDPY